MEEEPTIQFPEKIRNSERFGLLQTMLAACEQAWKEAIQPRMNAIRHAKIDAKSFKKGTDFFTDADMESEKIIKETLIAAHGESAFRIFGEESGTYTGNLEADITIRIDPIDGTEAFKFGKPNWSIMVGAYVGRDSLEQQIASAVYWPEYFNEILFSLEDAGVFIGNMTTGTVAEISQLDRQDDLGNIITAFYKHSNMKERGNDDAIVRQLEEAGARVRSITPTEVKEALETAGKRAMILDGDFNKVDFIGYSSLVRLGYRVFGWDGAEYNIDDPGLANKKLAIIPPGQAGEMILKIIGQC